MTIDQPRIFERRYFEDVYEAAYDQRNPRYKHRSYLREVRRVAPEGGTLLDVGCAYGSFLREAVGSYSCTGCDVSHHAVEVASGPAARRAGLPVRRPRALARWRHDVVTCFDVLEHVPDLDAALARLRAMLKPGGSWRSRSPCTTRRSGRLAGRLDKDPTHVHKLSRYEWLDRVDAAGFETFAGAASCVTTSAERGTCTGARAASGASARPSS